MKAANRSFAIRLTRHNSASYYDISISSFHHRLPEYGSRSTSKERRMAEGGRVMVAIDESECSIYALEWALENLRETAGDHSSSPLIIFTVQPIANLSYIPAATYGSARTFTSMTARRFPLSSSSSSFPSSSSSCYKSFSL